MKSAAEPRERAVAERRRVEPERERERRDGVRDRTRRAPAEPRQKAVLDRQGAQREPARERRTTAEPRQRAAADRPAEKHERRDARDRACTVLAVPGTAHRVRGTADQKALPDREAPAERRMRQTVREPRGRRSEQIAEEVRERKAERQERPQPRQPRREERVRRDPGLDRDAAKAAVNDTELPRKRARPVEEPEPQRRRAAEDRVRGRAPAAAVRRERSAPRRRVDNSRERVRRPAARPR